MMDKNYCLNFWRRFRVSVACLFLSYCCYFWNFYLACLIYVSFVLSTVALSLIRLFFWVSSFNLNSLSSFVYFSLTFSDVLFYNNSILFIIPSLLSYPICSSIFSLICSAFLSARILSSPISLTTFYISPCHSSTSILLLSFELTPTIVFAFVIFSPNADILSSTLTTSSRFASSYLPATWFSLNSSDLKWFSYDRCLVSYLYSC